MLDSNLLDTVSVLEKHNINYWLCHGTLLGIVRDSELIEWDPDIDIALWYQDGIKDRLCEVMNSIGFELDDYCEEYDYIMFSRLGGRYVDFSLYRKHKSENLSYSAWKTPKNRLVSILLLFADKKRLSKRLGLSIHLCKIIASLFRLVVLCLHKFNFLYKPMGYSTPTNFLLKFRKIEVRGTSFVIPDLAKEVLQFIYGDDWTAPKKNYEWTEDSKAIHSFKDK